MMRAYLREKLYLCPINRKSDPKAQHFMDFLYLVILGFLLILALFDLSVGVANDAVNFLSPAVGARAAKFKAILTVAAVGIFIGASTSSGMMDIARHGILHPAYYSFADVMCIFLAVSATDVILLDIFNTLGMPTSTTVSMVFGLLGGASALALMNIVGTTQSYSDLINTDKALTVIIGIFLSVAIAFVVGLLVMWITRIIFTFSYKRNLRWTIAVYGGVSISLIFYFLLTKGLGNSPMVQDSAFGQFLHEHPMQILIWSFLGFTALVELLHLLGMNIFKIIVLFGTFSLAMAFAGNDLVNFIGVPLAGLESFLDFTQNGRGIAAADYKMSALDGASTLPGVSWYLIGAGLVMTIAIWTSKKAQQVVQNTINLSSQNETEEVFSSSKVARQTVRGVLNFNHHVARFVPVSVQEWINSRFNTEQSDADEGVAFDLVRASVNLVLSGLLITVGTTLQLPLSTTYVAFMVAMGSSLADRAWGRETAVYRITGVITVIGGWFITAGAAFIMAFIIATINSLGGFVAMLGIILLIAFTLINNNRRFKKKRAESEHVDTLFRQMVSVRDKQEVWSLLRTHVAQTQVHLIENVRIMLQNIADGFIEDNIKKLRSVTSLLADEKEMWKRYRRKEILGMRKIDALVAVEKNTWFHLGANSISQIHYGLRRMLDPIQEHVDNNFTPLPEAYGLQFRPIIEQAEMFLYALQTEIETNDFSNSDELLVEGNALKSEISKLRHQLQDSIQRGEGNIKIDLLYLSTLQETQEIISQARHLLRAAKRFNS